MAQFYCHSAPGPSTQPGCPKSGTQMWLNRICSDTPTSRATAAIVHRNRQCRSIITDGVPLEETSYGLVQIWAGFEDDFERAIF
jgi:hypothetical protein